MAITAGGVGSGLDIEGIVYQLMQLERIPVVKLESKNKELDSQLSAYGKLRSSLSSFQTAMEGLGDLDKFKVFSSVSSDEDVLTASTTSSAASGTYSLEVTRLAQNHKVGSTGTEAIASGDIFTGTLEITLGSNTAPQFTVNTGTGMTLSQIRDEINNSVDNPGITATVLNLGTSDQKLVLTSDESGEENAMTTIVDNTTNTSNNLATLSLDTINKNSVGGDLVSLAELDSAFSIDGYDINSSSNDISDVIDGISLELKGIGSSQLTLSRDNESIEKSVEDFVDSYNDLYDVIQKLSKGDLAGDSTLRSMQSAIRNVYSSAISGLTGTYNAPYQLGIKTDGSSGKLTLDKEQLREALDNDFASVAEVFANDDQGVAFRLAELADTFLDPGNVINNREEGIRSRKRTNNFQIDSLEARLELKETALRAKFASLDSLIGSMQSTSSFIASSLF